MTRDILEFSHEELHELYLRLTRFAAERLRKITPRLTQQAPEFVNIAMLKHLDGARRWNREKYDLYGYLCGVILSEISNMIQSYDNRNTHSLDGLPLNMTEVVMGSTTSAEEAIIRRNLLRKFREQIRRQDPALAQLLDWISPLENSDDKDSVRRPALSDSDIRRLMRKLKKSAHKFNAFHEEEARHAGE